MRCLQNMLGMIIFIRIQWITEEVGLGMTIGFIFLAGLISILTTITVAAFCTDQKIGFFSTVATYCSPAVSAGLTMLYIASNVIAYGCFAVGFAETLVNYLRNSGFIIIDGSGNDMRIFSALFCLNVLIVAILRSTESFRCRAAVLLLALLAILMQLIGLMMPSVIIEKRYNSTTFNVSDYNPYGKKGMGFIVYFPAVTCIFSGLTLPGNFRNKKKELFKGTSLAIVVSSALYLLTAALESHFITVSPLVLESVTGTRRNLKAVAILKSLPVTLIALGSMFYCAYIAMIIAGRTAQDISKSPGLVHLLSKLSHSYGKEHTPRKAYVVFSIIAAAISMLADFNRVASIFTIYYLSTFCLLNYMAFMASLKRERPTFRYFHKWIALITSFLCVHLVL
ncbi:amino acid permease, partial [Oesophagostomum dentatum]